MRTLRNRFWLLALVPVLVNALLLLALTAAREGELARVATDQRERNTTRALAMLEISASQLQNAAHDYASWDNTYDYLQGENGTYWENDFTDSSLVAMGADLAVMIDLSQRLVHVHSLGLAQDEQQALVQHLVDGILSEPGLSAQLGGCLTGPLDLGGQPSLIVLCPVVPHSYSAPAAGQLIVVSLLGQEAALPISTVLGSTVRFRPLRPESGPSGVPQDHGDGATLAIAGLLDQAGFEIEVATSAGDLPTGLLEAGGMGLAFVFLSMLVGVSGIVFAHHWVLRPVEHLRDEVEIMAAQGTLAKPLPITGEGELQALMRAINTMLANFKRTHGEWLAVKAAMLELARFPEENPAPVLRLSPAGLVMYSNPPGTELLRVLAGEGPAVDYLVSDWYAMVRQVLESGDRVEREYRVADRVYSCLFVPMPGDGYVNVYGNDITERLRSDQQLREQRDFALQVMNTMGQGLTITDAENAFEYVNPAFAKMLGYVADELIGRHPSDVTAKEDWQVLAQARATRLDGRAATYESRLQGADGRVVHALVASVPRWRDGQEIGAISVVTDLTERKQAESEIRSLNTLLEHRVQSRTAELAAANRALEGERALLAQRVAERTADLQAANSALARASQLKDEFLANMSHELRTPLNTVLGMAEAVREGIMGPVTPDQDGALVAVEESARHLLSLINDILDLSKIEAGHFSLQVDEIDPVALCAASLRMVKQAAQKKSIELTSHLDPDVDVAQADGRRLKQMLVNLLSNAVKFTPDGGRVGLELRGDRGRRELTFSVWDSGIGIAPEDLERLFQPFTQLDSRLSRQYQGTGLGLSLVLRMAEMHAGRVVVASRPGQGSRFDVILPWRVAAETPAGTIEPEPALVPIAPNDISLRGLRLLLADDDEENINLFGGYLRRRGAVVIIAREGREALHIAQTEALTAIITDVQMPEIDGLEMIARLRATGSPSARVPVVAVTALAMPGDRERCLAAGADAYLSKPIGLRELAETVLRVSGAGSRAPDAYPRNTTPDT
jgi:PAS domain S-box-containing protein